MVLTLLFAVFLVLAGLLVQPSVNSYLERRSELKNVKEERSDLQAEISEIKADIEGVLDYDGLSQQARCYGPFVEPGLEVYSVPGLQGCVVSVPD